MAMALVSMVIAPLVEPVVGGQGELRTFYLLFL